MNEWNISKSLKDIMLEIMVLALIYCKIQTKMENISRLPIIVMQNLLSSFKSF